MNTDDRKQGGSMFLPGAMQDNAPAGQSDGDDDTTMSLHGIARADTGLPEADLDLHSMNGASRFMNQGTLLVLALVAVAAGSLYFMRMTQSDMAKLNLDPKTLAEIEVWIGKARNPEALPADDPMRPENFKGLLTTADIIATFTVDPTERQVPIEYVKKNPFDLHRTRVEPETGKVVAARDDTEEKRTERLRVLRAEIKRFKINSIMASGARKIAIIDGNFYQPGQKIGSFTIQDISTNGLVLTVSDELLKPEERSFNISMDDGVDTTGTGGQFKR